MTDIMRAIKHTLDGVQGPLAPLTLATGGIHLITAPRGATFPHIIISMLGGDIEETFSDGRWEPHELQIGIWDEHRGDVTRAFEIDKGTFAALHKKELKLIDGNTGLMMLCTSLPNTDYDEQYIMVTREWIFEQQTYTV